MATPDTEKMFAIVEKKDGTVIKGTTILGPYSDEDVPYSVVVDIKSGKTWKIPIKEIKTMSFGPGY